MRFELSTDAFTASVEDHLRREIIAFAIEGRHTVLVQEEAQAAFQQWRSEQSRRVQEELDFGLTCSLEEEALRPHSISVIVGGATEEDDWGTEPPRVSPRTARDMGRQAVRLLVEDLDSDQAFLLAVAPPEYAAPLRELLASGWLEAVHGGGSRLQRLVEKIASDPTLRRRVLALFDSDALQPGQPANKATSLVEICRRLGVAHHCLERRESENYLPPQAIRRWALRHWRTRQDRASAWLRLSRLQRHHFDMKEGFGDSEPIAFYGDLTAKDRRVLRRGFGPDIWQEFNEIDPDWVDRDGQRPELTRILTALLRLR